MAEIIQWEESELPDSLDEITDQIVSFMKNIETSIFEIGRRLKFVKESIPHGAFGSWLEKSLEFHPSTASRFIAAYEQFGNIATSQNIGKGKIFEMLALPESIDRQQFLENSYFIPSIAETKTVEQMTVKELREVTKPLKEAEKRRRQAERVGESKLATEPLRHGIFQEDGGKENNVMNSLAENPGCKLVVKYQAENNIEAITLIKDFSRDMRELVEKYSPLRLRLKEIEAVDNHTQKKFMDYAKMLIEFINDISPDYDKSKWKNDRLDQYLMGTTEM